MSQENVEIVREGWRRFDPADLGTFDELLGLYAADCVYEDFPEAPDAATYTGREGVRQALHAWAEMWDGSNMELVELIDAGEAVVAVCEMRGRAKGSGVPVELSPAIVYEMRHGKVVRQSAFTSRRQALEAAGLSE